MSTYAIGDLQGSFGPLQRLLDSINFDASKDRLWFVGDLVNRGTESLQCLRFVRALGDRAVSVLGNHDLHLLCVAEGCAKPRKSDTLGSVLNAPDRIELLAWLRQRPMMHVEGDFALVHAGLLPQWSISEAKAFAAEVETELRSPGYRKFLAAMYGDEPDAWSNKLGGYDRLRVIVNAMTRMRLCTATGRMDFTHQGELQNLPRGFLPWFDVPQRRSAGHTVIAGHWSALGLKIEPNLINIDTGCVWGRALTAVRLEDRKILQVSCAGGKAAPP